MHANLLCSETQRTQVLTKADRQPTCETKKPLKKPLQEGQKVKTITPCGALQGRVPALLPGQNFTRRPVVTMVMSSYSGL